MGAATPVERLRRSFALLLGLGMRESSGRYCEGRDRSANNTGADTAEAGLFQMSFDLVAPRAELLDVFHHYQSNPGEGLREIFEVEMSPPPHRRCCAHADGFELVIVPGQGIALQMPMSVTKGGSSARDIPSATGSWACNRA